MRRIVVFLFFIIVYTTAAKSQNVTDLKSQPIAGKISESSLQLKENEFDFGNIPQGKPVTHVFEALNTGEDSLRILNVQASCGCTTPEWERGKVIAKGEKTFITVGFNAAVKGKFSKEITITYNNNQIRQITIKGDVWETPSTSAPENKELGSLKDL